MTNLSYSFIIQSEKLVPDEIEIKYNIKFSEKNSKGEIGKIGRYKGKEIPFGSGSIKFIGEKDEVLIEKICNFVKDLSDIEEYLIILHLDVEYVNQCNFEIEQIYSKFAIDINIPITSSCYQIDNKE